MLDKNRKPIETEKFLKEVADLEYRDLEAKGPPAEHGDPYGEIARTALEIEAAERKAWAKIEHERFVG